MVCPKCMKSGALCEVVDRFIIIFCQKCVKVSVLWQLELDGEEIGKVVSDVLEKYEPEELLKVCASTINEFLNEEPVTV